MKEIDKLIEVSRKYGSDPRYVIAGGGNTSYKDAAHLWVKASGHALAPADTRSPPSPKTVSQSWTAPA